MEKNNLIIKFTDQSSSFTYGVEFGRLLEKIERGDNIVMNNGFPVRYENIEVIKLACNEYGYTPLFNDRLFDGWVGFIGIKKTVLN
jgi:hypothetical protein